MSLSSFWTLYDDDHFYRDIYEAFRDLFQGHEQPRCDTQPVWHRDPLLFLVVDVQVGVIQFNC